MCGLLEEKGKKGTSRKWTRKKKVKEQEKMWSQLRTQRLTLQTTAFGVNAVPTAGWNVSILVRFSIKAWSANIFCICVHALSLCRPVSAVLLVYVSSFNSRLSVLAIFRGGAVFSPSGCSCSRFFAAFFLSHCWWRYRSKMFVFSVTIICSDGYSRVGRYTDGRRFDALHTESAWNLLKLFLL